jgi:hypothetical protein
MRILVYFVGFQLSSSDSPLMMTLQTDVSILVVELGTTIRCLDREQWS